MPMVRSMRLLNSVEAGLTNAAALEALLADAGRLSEWSAIMGVRGYVQRLLASPGSMDIVCGSPRAIGAMLANPRAASLLYGSEGLATLSPNAWGVYAPTPDAFVLGGTSGTEVTRWRNATGIALRDMVQTTSANCPLLNGANSPLGPLRTLQFDGTNDFMEAGETFNQPTAYTVFVVYRRGNSVVGGLFGDTGGGLGAQNASEAVTCAGGANVVFSTAAGTANAWALSRFRRQSASALYHGLNGGGDSTVVSTQISNLSTSGARIGSAYIQGVTYLNGRIAEVWLLAGNGDGASPEVQRITNLLKAKYKL